MKNGLVIVVGVLMIVAASFLAAGTSSQDNTLRPQLAQVMATAFHVTPSATPRPTFSPIPTATPLRITQVDPRAQELLAVLFQYPYQGASIITSQARLEVERLEANDSPATLVLAGDGATAADGMHRFPAAFGAVLAWQDGEYVVKFKHVELGHQDALVSVAVSESGRVNFVFQDIFIGAHEMGGGFQRTIIVQPCNVPLAMPELRALGRTGQSAIEWQCF
jgi:hypothetical protein